MFCLGDMMSFACHYNWQFGSFSTKNTPMVFDTITNGIAYKLLARNDNYPTLIVLGSRLDSFLLTHRS